MKLSKEVKLEIYREALLRLNTERDQRINLYICPNLISFLKGRGVNLSGYYIDDEIVNDFFPEFYKYKPEYKPHLGWWPDHDFSSREKVLQTIINELEAQI